MADVTAHDLQLRAITTGFMNSFDFAFVTWWPLIFYPVTDAPHFEKGYIASLVTGALVIPLVGVIAFLEKRDRAAGKIGRTFEVDTDRSDYDPSPSRTVSEGEGLGVPDVVATQLPAKL